MPSVGILSPGEMGSAVGAVLRSRGLRVLTCLEGRGSSTRRRAEQAGLEALPTLAALVREADLLLSIVPPAAALETAERVATAVRDAETDLLYVDCNAVAPRTAAAVAAVLDAAGARVADAGIFGGPPPHNSNRLYVSGPAAAEAAQLTQYGLDVRVLEGPIGRASGLKMCYAALTKGLQALGLELLVAGRLLGVEDVLRSEQRDSQPDVVNYLERALPSMPPKAERWVGEMEEIARCFGDLGLPPGLFAGVADVYRSVARTELGRPGGTGSTQRDAREILASLASDLGHPASHA